MMVAAIPNHLNSGELSRVYVLGVLYKGGSGGHLNSRDLSKNPVTARRCPPKQELGLIAIPDLTFVVSGVLFAVMDCIADKRAEVAQGLSPGPVVKRDLTEDFCTTMKVRGS